LSGSHPIANPRCTLINLDTSRLRFEIVFEISELFSPALQTFAFVFVLPMETTPFEKFPAMRILLDDPTMNRLLAFEKLGPGVVPSTRTYPGIDARFTP
jgi:hypothetical protein